MMSGTPVNRRAFVHSMLLAGLAAGADTATAPKLRVAVIGHTGKGDYGHGLDTLWLKLPETEIVAVADADAAGLEKAKQRLHLPDGFADYREMLAATKPDLVAICPRHVNEHAEMALAAIGAGAKGIYMEKPFCADLKQARAIVDAAERSKVKIALAHRNRYHPALPVAKERIASGLIGRVLEVRGRGKEDDRGGVLDLWVLGSHVFNIGVYFAGEPISCTATILGDGKPVTRADVKQGKEGIGPVAGNELHARFEMSSGIPMFFESVAKAGVKEANFGLQIIGTRGIVDVRIDSEPLVHFLPGNPFRPAAGSREWTPITSAGPGTTEPLKDIKDQVGGHLGAARDLIAAIREDRQPLCGEPDGALTVEMIFAILESHRRNGARVAFPLELTGNPLDAL